MMNNQLAGIFNNALQFWTTSDLAMWSVIASFALCGAFVVHKLQIPKRRKKFSDWRSMKLVAIIPALLKLSLSYVTESYADLPACAFAAFIGAYFCYLIHYTVKNPKEFVRILLLPVWLFVQILIIASQILQKRSRV